MKLSLALVLLAACKTPTSPPAPAPAPTAPTPAPTPPPTATLPASIVLPGGEGGIGFDDLRFSAELGRVLAPAGRTGALDLVDPASGAVTSITGFSSEASFGGGHGQGTTSVDDGEHLLFAIDRDRMTLDIVDPQKGAIVASAKLAGKPDYVRYVAPRHELWVTEPNKKQIEYFTLAGTHATHAGAFTVEGGPESLVIDDARGRAYTHTWDDATVVIDLATHKEVARWKNGCAGSRGIALDAARGLLFVGCEEGKATALDVTHDGAQRGQVTAGKGVDIIAYDPARQHLYVPGGDAATLTIVGVAPTGALTSLATVPVAADAHCVTVDDRGHAYVCDPKRGALTVVTDNY